MIKLSKDESGLINKLLNKELPLIIYNQNNEVEVVDREDYNEYDTKFKYDPYPKFDSNDSVRTAKNKGVNYKVPDPYDVQRRLTRAKRNDRFKNLPGVVLGIDKNHNYYFYIKGRGNDFKDITISSILRFSSKSEINTDSDKYYHVYSPFRRVSRKGIYDKNYSLKVISWLLNHEDYCEDLIRIFKLLVKGTLISSSINLDYIVTIKSSKNINKLIVNEFVNDPYFKNTKIVMVEKPATKDVIKEYNTGIYPTSEFFDNLKDDDTIKMQSLSPVNRKIYARISKKLLSKHKLNETGKNIIFIDDLITTGNTLSNILIPLFENGNNLIPLSFLIR